MSNFASKTINAGWWSAIEIASRYLAQLASTVILARMLKPEDFGLLAIVAIFTTLAATIAESGFSTALIQRQTTNIDDETTAFFFTVCTSIAATVLLAGLAPYIATLFGQPLLSQVIPILALTILFTGSAAVPDALLIRRMAFRKRTTAEIISSVFPMGLAIFLAWAGYGLWSLVWQSVASSLLRSALLFNASSWRPKGRYRPESFRLLFGFGAYMLASNILNTLSLRLQALLIGKLVDTRTLGFYTIAQTIQSAPTSLLGGVLNRIGLPTFASIAHDNDRLSEAFRRTLRLTMFVFFPLMIGTSIVSRPLVIAVFGPQWSPAAPILSILALGASLWPMHILNLSVISSLGRGELFFRLEIIKQISCIALVLALSPWGALGVAGAVTLSSVFSVYINTYYARKLICYGVVEQIKDQLGIFFCTTASSCLAALTYTALGQGMWPLIIAAVEGVAIYIALAVYVDPASISEVHNTINHILQPEMHKK